MATCLPVAPNPNAQPRASGVFSCSFHRSCCGPLTAYRSFAPRVVFVSSMERTMPVEYFLWGLVVEDTHEAAIQSCLDGRNAGVIDLREI